MISAQEECINRAISVLSEAFDTALIIGTVHDSEKNATFRWSRQVGNQYANQAAAKEWSDIGNERTMAVIRLQEERRMDDEGEI
jgi:hypothetical protein